MSESFLGLLWDALGFEESLSLKSGTEPNCVFGALPGNAVPWPKGEEGIFGNIPCSCGTYLVGVARLFGPHSRPYLAQCSHGSSRFLKMH